MAKLGSQTQNMEAHESTYDLVRIRESLTACLNSPNGQPKTKDIIRRLHESQRAERAARERGILERYGDQIMSHFAEGREVEPRKIRPKLVPITESDSLEGRLFRAATLLWSVPVSRGYGRRMRYLVMDGQNGRLVGIIGLGDPVFNLKCRDDWIGWTVEQRSECLASVFDAYVLGAVPPYSLILGSKLIASLVASQEIWLHFRERYAHREGLISRRVKGSHLVLITTTSALGRSSVYNRLRLPNIVNFLRIGTTDGWGHFTVTDELFRQVRAVLKEKGDPYFNNYRFGQGPSWRLRALRKACGLLGIDENSLRHGIKREVYAIPLAHNWRDVLLRTELMPEYQTSDMSDIAAAALDRWVIPRSERTADWLSWNRQDAWNALTKYLSEPDPVRDTRLE